MLEEKFAHLWIEYSFFFRFLSPVANFYDQPLCFTRNVCVLCVLLTIFDIDKTLCLFAGRDKVSRLQ